MLSPYQYATNNPVTNLDLDGLEGVNNNAVRNSPLNVNAPITSNYLDNTRPVGASNPHGGLDYGIPTGTNIYATASGTVVRANWSRSYGNLVIIDHGPAPDGNGQRIYSLYAHNSRLNVSAGDQINVGDQIATSGNTGSGSHGAHLHYGVYVTSATVDESAFYYRSSTRDPATLPGLLATQINANSLIVKGYLNEVRLNLNMAVLYDKMVKSTEQLLSVRARSVKYFPESEENRHIRGSVTIPKSTT